MPRELYKKVISPFLDKRDSERWHKRAVDALHIAEATPFGLKLIEYASYQHERFQDSRLEVELSGVIFENPLAVGAGWDKAGRAVRGLYTLGFAGVEVGSVLAYPQEGNPKPRQWILGDGVALNRMGFNSPGVEGVARNLDRYRDSGIPTGVSLGKNKLIEPKDAPEAHAIVAGRLYDDASYFAVNVSSPNTPGLRQLQDKGPLTDIVQAVNSVMDEKGGRKPLMVKIAPELTISAISDVMEVVQDNGATGIIAANTTTDPDLKAKYGERWRTEDGGLSGDDWQYRERTKRIIAHIFGETNGEMKLMASGGAKDYWTTLEYMRSGATIVQFVTAIRGQGPSLAGRINRKLVDSLAIRGFNSVNEFIGMDLKK